MPQKETLKNVRTPVCFRILSSSLTSVSIFSVCCYSSVSISVVFTSLHLRSPVHVVPPQYIEILQLRGVHTGTLFVVCVNIQIYRFPLVWLSFSKGTNINCALFCCECICRPGPRLCTPRRVPENPVNHRDGSLVSSRRRMPRIRPPDRRRYLGAAAAP